MRVFFYDKNGKVIVPKLRLWSLYQSSIEADTF